MIPNVLSIAGTDPTGGAGIHADLKTFCAHGVYGMAAITAVVAQNTQGVTAVHAIPPDFLTEQLDSVFTDVRVDAVKIGMLGGPDTVRAVAAALERYRPAFVVLDPVMVAKSGDRLLESAALEALRDELLPLADVITPNLPEAADLLGEPELCAPDDMAEQAGRLRKLGANAVLLKGGHLHTVDSPDVLLAGETITTLRSPRIDTRNTHGTGCTLSSSIAALHPRRADLLTAVTEAKDYLTQTLRNADRLDVGHGNGPVAHLRAWWEPAA